MEQYFDRQNGFIKNKHLPIVLIIGFCYLFDIMDNQLFNKLIVLMTADLGLTEAMVAKINTFNFLGMFLGGIIGAISANIIGRKKSVILSLLLLSGGSLLTGLAWNYETLMIFRMITTMGTVSMLAVALVYMAEMLPKENRAKYQGYAIMMGTMSLPLISIFINFTKDWRLCMFIGALGIFILPFAIKYLEESPRWLVSKGRVFDAVKVLNKFYPDVKNENYIPTTIEKQYKIKDLVSDKKYFKRFLVVAFIYTMFDFYNQYLGVWQSYYIMEIDPRLVLFFLLAIVISFMNPLGDLLSAKLGDKYDKKKLMIALMIVMAAAEFFISLYANMFNWAGWKCVSIVAATCWDTLIWIYIAENFPTELRSVASGLILSVTRGFLLITAGTVPFFNALGGWFLTNNTTTIAILLGAVVLYKFGINTHKKSLEECQN